MRTNFSVAVKSPKAASRLCIVVLGYIVRGPLGGLVWHHLQYVLGLAQLGHDVYFIEDSDDYPSCYDPTTNEVDTNPDFGLRFISEVFKRYGLSERWAYYDAHQAIWYGLNDASVREICGRADLLLNLSGVNPLRPWVRDIPKRALVDTDPLFTQIKHLSQPAFCAEAEAHTSFFTFGENIPARTSQVPDDGFQWQATRQPIVLDAWAATKGCALGRWTTVMQWDSYASREYEGKFYGMKSDSFAPHLELPRLSNQEFELAIGSRTAPRELLASYGWRVRDPLEVTRNAWTYQHYIRESKAEFTVAKHGYVVSRTGWFSERSAAYLASARPVVVEDTGFTAWLPTGAGIFAFNSPADALECVEAVNARYEFHCAAAREIASSYFDSNIVLPKLIDRALNSTTRPARTKGAGAGQESSIERGAA